MTAPDAREWYPFDHSAPGKPSEQLAWEQFRTAHPAVTFARVSIVGKAWLCIEGWIETPVDQGPLPTEADIPIGFG
jgi:hypothetical protein